MVHHSLVFTYPALAREWHPEKNRGLTPEDVSVWSHKIVWWKCGKGHVWRAIIANRSKGKGCPYCAGKAACEENCLQTVNPVLGKEWHPMRNGRLSAKDVTPGSHRKVWWRCGRGHEWQATIYSRSAGNGCPLCHSATSGLELRTLCEMKYLFEDVQHRARVYGEECDVFIPGLGVAIEIDGGYWHRDKLEQDKRKNVCLRERGVTLIRVREKGLEKTCDSDIFVSRRDSELEVVSRIVKRLGEEKGLNGLTRRSIVRYLKGKRLANDSEYKRLLEMLPSPLSGLSLEERNPKLAREWHSELNGKLTARNVSSGSDKKVWWRCGRGHEWEATISSRSQGNGCPYCAGRAVCEENCLRAVNPVLAREWHPTKNGSLTAGDVMPGSNKKAWWRCGKGHEWEATIGSRSDGSGCPHCAGKTVCEENCLRAVNSALAREWHPAKNEGLTAGDVRPWSNKKVWWRCGKGHEWAARVADRSRGNGCPYCAGRAVCEDNCLRTVDPVLAREWHRTRNGRLTAGDVMPGSHKKAWWMCGRGHEWLARVYHRSRREGCPYCAGRRRVGP